ncbi:TetR/AcrR family transcriptional regulator [Hoyosella sp. YIM 151337]|uniref:TetR/AcrR family transcriptional regulator n=1 Tax=Hoyosella sp. YIM 151337 TaxID=2992742 RepID=UPI0022358475|nr:TetR/AcrR family transcriptional regulator [Hoyosella sp. YIM 151337]MCW4352620.1 TetR/AcrR family transcriptional regulator [Hoyosella sp. YIM 151337]
MQRLTRRESQQQTRQRVLDAATELFLDRGYRVTSIGEVADAAGYSHGAVYSNFASKTALGVAVVDQLYDRAATRLREAIHSAGEDVTGLLTAITAWSAETIGDARWTRLETEVTSAAGDGEIRDANAQRYKRLRAAGIDIADTLAAERGIRFALPPDELMIGVLGLALGIGIQRAADPSIPGSTFTSFLAALLPAGK